jgi:hypothetical protein
MDAPKTPTSTPPEGEKAARLFEEAAADGESRAKRSPPPAPAAIARHFPELEILEIVGEGGMGVVYRARHRRLDRLVALKVLPKELADDPAFAERFAREARTLARLDHPGIVRVFDFGVAEGLTYLVLEYVDGANLRQVMAAGRLAPAEALAIVPQVCEALQYAHDRGVVHRDVKPENVLLDSRGKVKIADFGLAKIVGAPLADVSLTGTGQVMGTIHYMAPEQYRTPKDVDHRADLYSLGVVFYEMLTGEVPVGRFHAPSESTRLDARVDAIVLRALERERELRYQRAEEIRTDVTRLSVAGPESVPARAHGTESPAAASGGRGRGRLALALSIAALPVAVLAYVLVHEAWGGVVRGTPDAEERETVKAVAAGAILALGAVSGAIAAFRARADAGRRRVHKFGATAAVAHVVALLALAILTAGEVGKHARASPFDAASIDLVYRDGLSTRTAGDGPIDVEGITAAWNRLVHRLGRERTFEAAVEEYVRADRARLLVLEPSDRESVLYGSGIGPALIAFGLDRLGEIGVRRIRAQTDPDSALVTVGPPTVPGTPWLRFEMRREDGRWKFVASEVEMDPGGR